MEYYLTILISSRITRLEQTVAALVEKLDARRGLSYAEVSSTSPVNPPPVNNIERETPSAAPVFLIRDVASQVGVRQQSRGTTTKALDIIDQGLLTFAEATVLIELFVWKILFFTSTDGMEDFWITTEDGLCSTRSFHQISYCRLYANRPYCSVHVA